MKIGYSLVFIGNDNNGVLEDYIEVEEDKYLNLYSKNYMSNTFKLGSKFRKYDASVTYDGYDIVSEKFRSFCVENNYDKVLEFIPVPKEPNHYWLKVIGNIVEFDAEDRETRFLNYSKKYNAYEEIIGATPVVLKNKQKLGDNFYRTDLCFGSGLSKNPIILVREETRKKIKAAKLTGVYFEEIVESTIPLAERLQINNGVYYEVTKVVCHLDLNQTVFAFQALEMLALIKLGKLKSKIKSPGQPILNYLNDSQLLELKNEYVNWRQNQDYDEKGIIEAIVQEIAENGI